MSHPADSTVDHDAVSGPFDRPKDPLAAGDQFVELDLMNREFRRSAPQAELASLREFNSKLLERIGEFRKRNLELSAGENSLRKSLAARDEEIAVLQRALAERDVELDTYKAELESRLSDFDASREEMNRNVARLSDQKWSDDLEIETLKAREASQREEINQLREEAGQIPILRAEIGERHNAEAAKAAQIVEANSLITALEEEIESGKCQSQSFAATAAQAAAAAHERQVQLTDSFRVREAQLLGAFENLRAEYASIDKCYKEAIEAITQLRLESESGVRRHHESQRQIAALTTENARLEQLLKVEDNRIETECRKLQTSQERVTYLDQHLRQLADTTRRERAEIFRIAKVLGQEVQAARLHPVHDYLRAVELEIAHIQSALGAASGLSPTRMKSEVRLAQAMEHREVLRSIITNSESQLEERAQTVQSIIKSAGSPV